MAETKSPTQTPVIPTQAGSGLRRGNPGNKGGPGRPPNSLRNLCHKRFKKHLPKVDKMLKKESLKDSDLLQAMSLFARYGSEAAMPVPELRARLQQQNAIIRELLAPDEAERIIQAMRGVWVAG